jgi:hypothetical protein
LKYFKDQVYSPFVSSKYNSVHGQESLPRAYLTGFEFDKMNYDLDVLYVNKKYGLLFYKNESGVFSSSIGSICQKMKMTQNDEIYSIDFKKRKDSIGFIKQFCESLVGE